MTHTVIVDERQRMAGQPELHDLVDDRRGPRRRDPTRRATGAARP